MAGNPGGIVAQHTHKSERSANSTTFESFLKPCKIYWCKPPLPSLNMTAAELAQKTRLLILDVDGVMTDGSITYSDTSTETKSFNVQDGLGIKLLHQAGIIMKKPSHNLVTWIRILFEINALNQEYLDF